MTQEFVTLPREVVERALEALKYEKDANNPLDWHHDKTMNALRASLEQPLVDQEPVATVSIEVTGSTTKVDIEWGDLLPQLPAGSYDLYTHPQPRIAPLSLTQIAEVFGWKPGFLPTPEQVHDARAIEAAHNIK